LSTYRYRQDVHCCFAPREAFLHRLLAAAYALIQPAAIACTGEMVLNAFKVNVPVIMEEPEGGGELNFDSAVYRVPYGQAPELAGAMMKLYKDEKLRASLIQSGSAQWPVRNGMAETGALMEALEFLKP
jgi:hypothetical protein